LAPNEAVASISSDSSDHEEAGSDTYEIDVQCSKKGTCSQFAYRNLPVPFSMIPFVSTAEVELAWARYNYAKVMGKGRSHVAKRSKEDMAKPPGQFHVPIRKGGQFSVAAPIP
jgi:hypothetical protein